MKIWLNHQLIDESEAVIPVRDHGFLYGVGFFESFRTYQGVPFQLSEHLQRLQQGCAACRIPWTLTDAEIVEAIQQLAVANQWREDFRVRLSVSAGSAPVGLPSEAYTSPNVMLMGKSLGDQAELTASQAKGKVLQQLKLARSTPELSFRAKSFQYLNLIAGSIELQSLNPQPDTEGLMMNAQGQIVEGLSSNVFWVKDNILYTPSSATGALLGITRNTVIELAAAVDLPVEQGEFPWSALWGAAEIFVTNSVQELMPVPKVGDVNGRTRQVGNGQIGHWTSVLVNSYRKLTRNEAGFDINFPGNNKG